jgi:hypothetical protein
MTLTIIGAVLLGVVAVVVAVILVSKLVLHLLKGPLEGRIAAQYGKNEILMQDLGANSFGLESKGVMQLRGNGGLVLTAKYLHFFMFIPKREVRIPLEAITQLALTKSHLGKATIYDLLKVHFAVDGQPDSIAWYLADSQAWKNRIETLLAKSLAGKPA